MIHEVKAAWRSASLLKINRFISFVGDILQVT